MGAIDTILAALQNVMPSFARSEGSIEAKIIDVVGTYADSEAAERRNTLNVIENALASQKITRKEYYRRKAVAFQAGDVLIYDPINQMASYGTIDTSKQIIKQAYIIGEYPTFSLLVNAVGNDGHLRKLTEVELASFKTYFEEFQPLGMNVHVNSLEVARITDPSIVIYVRAGVDSSDVANKINGNLLAYETVLRSNNAVTLTEIVDVIQQDPRVLAVGFANPIATEQQLDGTTRQTRPVEGVFNLVNGAFTFGTEITTSHIKTLQ